MWLAKSFLVCFALFFLALSGTSQALTPSSGSSGSSLEESDLLSDQQIKELVTDLNKLPEPQKQELIKLLKHFRARTNLSESHLKEALSKLEKQESNLTALSTSLKEERQDHLIVYIELVAVTALVSILATKLLWR